jgi:DNA-binding NtrC family response regulator
MFDLVSDALREVEAGQYDVVVTDYNFPGEPPEPLIEHLQASASATKIILMSGSLSVPDLGVPFLKKPFTLLELRPLVG